jgi:PAS domain S-box-containing protein
MADGAVFLVGFVYALAYLYGGATGSASAGLPLALGATLGFCLLAVGSIACLAGDALPLGFVVGPSREAQLLRAFLPFPILTVASVAGLTFVVGQSQAQLATGAVLAACLATAAMVVTSFFCLRIARTVGINVERTETDLRDAERQSRAYARELKQLNNSLEERVARRTSDLEANRDRLDQFFTLFTSLQNPDSEERTFQLVLTFCRRLGYDLAMLSLVDHNARQVRAVAAVGSLVEVVGRTVRALNGNDILAVVAREGRTRIVPDSAQDPHCEQEAVAAAGLRGQIVLPLVSGDHEVVGVLQVGSHSMLNPAAQELHALETLASEAARALAGLKHMEEIRALNRQLEKRNRQLQKLATDLKQIALAEHNARSAQRESEARLRLLLESSGEGVYGVDLAGRCTFINTAAAAMLGCRPDETLGRDMHVFTHYKRNDGSPYPAEECPVLRVLATGEGCRVDREVLWRNDGSAFSAEYSAYPIRDGQVIKGAVVTFTDITRRRQAEEQLHVQNALLQQTARSEREAHEALKKAQSQLVQSEKLAALGQMVAGVAHEINNPLAFVINNLAVLQRDARSLRDLLVLYQQAGACLEEHQPTLALSVGALAERIDLDYTLDNLEGLIGRSRDGLKRIEQIVRDLRDFARLDDSDLQEVNLNTGIESTIHILRAQGRRQEVELIMDAAALPVVCCYPAKINQVVLNLVANAIDACPPGGRVTVGTRPAPHGVHIHVRDTGCGIDPAIRDKIFDPFFTTKPPGKGTGLGLSISYQIIRDHGGTIQVQSYPGQGTCFTITLPLKPVPQDQRPRDSGGAARSALERPVGLVAALGE